MIIGARDFRRVLNECFQARRKANPAYSLRAFAKLIQLSPAQLSQVLSGKRGLSKESANLIGERLGFQANEIDYFTLLVSRECSRNRVEQAVATAKLDHWRTQLAPEGRLIHEDSFQVIADWYHFAILQVLKLPEAIHTPIWIGKQLNITTEEAIEALARLKRLNLIQSQNNRYEILENSVYTTDGVPSQALRKMHQQIILKALSSVEEQNVNERYLISKVLPLNKKNYPRAIEMLKKFHLEFGDEIPDAENPNQVYSLAIQFFKIMETQAHE